jgi:hydrogenase expression/formation protein HypE
LKRIMLAHGGGGEESRALLNGLVFKYFTDPALSAMEDAAVLETKGKIAFTTDGYTVSPIFFNGGDIGKLAVSGTVNDLAVMGARALHLGVSFIVEEGFSIEDFERILDSMKTELEVTGAAVAAGDTKVVPAGSADGIFITTTGIGEVLAAGLSAGNVQEGDAVIVSGTVGDHGACILALRQGIGLKTDLQSDCASLWPLVERLINAAGDAIPRGNGDAAPASIGIRAMRDPTRGGLAATLNEWAALSWIDIEVEEDAIPVKPQVRGVCELLGMDPLSLACEGRLVLAVREEDAARALDALKGHPLGRDAKIIGRGGATPRVNGGATPRVNGGATPRVNGGATPRVKGRDPRRQGPSHPLTPPPRPRVVLKSGYGTRRVLEYPSGELLPRIC